MEAIRQRFLDEALSRGKTTEVTLKVYAELLKEETKFKELQLAERRMAVLEEQTRLQKVKLRLAARSLRRRKVVKLEANAVQNAEVAEVEESKAKRIAHPSSKVGDGALESRDGERAQALASVVSRVEGILNEGGLAEDKVMEARAVLAERRKLLEKSREGAVGEIGGT